MGVNGNLDIDNLAKRYFIDLSANSREDTDENLRAWLWFSCPADLRDAVRERILALRRNTLPKFLIGDSADERTFVVHLHWPRFVAQVAEPSGEELPVVDWYDDPPADEKFLARLMREAGEFWQAEAARE